MLFKTKLHFKILISTRVSKWNQQGRIQFGEHEKNATFIEFLKGIFKKMLNPQTSV